MAGGRRSNVDQREFQDAAPPTRSVRLLEDTPHRRQKSRRVALT
jgi:hypothetical protein